MSSAGALFSGQSDYRFEVPFGPTPEWREHSERLMDTAPQAGLTGEHTEGSPAAVYQVSSFSQQGPFLLGSCLASGPLRHQAILDAGAAVRLSVSRKGAAAKAGQSA